MHVEKKSISSTKISLTITGTEVELTPIKSKVVERLGQNIKIPGFREGKAPLQVIEKNIDPNVLSSEFVNDAINELYIQAINNEDLNPVAQPTVEIKKFVPFTELQFTAEFAVVGKVKLGKYKSLGIKNDTEQIKPEEIEKVLKSLQLRQSTKNDVDRPAKKDDQVWIDFLGKDLKGEAINGADGKDYPIVLGSKTFIPGFEENVEGLRAGEKKEFTIPFPKDYGVAALAGKKVTFTVTVNKVQEVILPKADDELAKKVGPFKSIEELKSNISDNLKHEKSVASEREYENKLLEKILASSTVEIPEIVIEQQTAYEMDELRRNLTYRGQTYQEFLESEGTTEEKYKDEVVAPRAEKSVKISIILSEISKLEDIKLDPAELEAQISALRAQYQDQAMQAELDKPENRRDIASRMLTQKTVDRIKSLQ